MRFGAFEFEPRGQFVYTYNHVNNLAHDIRVESIVYLDESRLIPDRIGGKQLTDRDSWPLPELLFDRVDSENRQHKTLTTTKLPHQKTNIHGFGTRSPGRAVFFSHTAAN